MIGYDERMMGLALAEARNAAAAGEVPVGAILLDAAGNILAGGGNNCIAASDPAGHAEMIVIRKAAAARGNYRLPDTTLYVTLEPCVMCAGLLVHARIRRLVFGADDPARGGVVSRYRVGCDGVLNHSFQITGGVRADECSALLKQFFRERR